MTQDEIDHKFEECEHDYERATLQGLAIVFAFAAAVLAISYLFGHLPLPGVVN